jgi:hypothetical protein
VGYEHPRYFLVGVYYFSSPSGIKICGVGWLGRLLDSFNRRNCIGKAMTKILIDEIIESLLAEYDMVNSAFAKDLRKALEQPAPAHCEAGPEYCQQCLKESKPTYGSEEVRKLREVIESQANIIAKLEQPAPAQEPVLFSELAKRRVLDYIRGAYDLGYNDARNAKAIRGDSATGYKGREVEADHGVALLHSLQSLYTTPPAPAQPLTWVSVKDRLPPVDEDVLTYDVTYPDDGFDIERRLSEREWSVKYSVTHWMPLPDAPKAAHGITKGGAA